METSLKSACQSQKYNAQSIPRKVFESRKEQLNTSIVLKQAHTSGPIIIQNDPFSFAKLDSSEVERGILEVSTQMGSHGCVVIKQEHPKPLGYGIHSFFQVFRKFRQSAGQFWKNIIETTSKAQ